jgi:hypothetical protein
MSPAALEEKGPDGREDRPAAGEAMGQPAANAVARLA